MLKYSIGGFIASFLLLSSQSSTYAMDDNDIEIHHHNGEVPISSDTYDVELLKLQIEQLKDQNSVLEIALQSAHEESSAESRESRYHIQRLNEDNRGLYFQLENARKDNHALREEVSELEASLKETDRDLEVFTVLVEHAPTLMKEVFPLLVQTLNKSEFDLGEQFMDNFSAYFENRTETSLAKYKVGPYWQYSSDDEGSGSKGGSASKKANDEDGDASL